MSFILHASVVLGAQLSLSQAEQTTASRLWSHSGHSASVSSVGDERTQTQCGVVISRHSHEREILAGLHNSYNQELGLWKLETILTYKIPSDILIETKEEEQLPFGERPILHLSKKKKK